VNHVQYLLSYSICCEMVKDGVITFLINTSITIFFTKKEGRDGTVETGGSIGRRP
jgi:hypothetical protein